MNEFASKLFHKIQTMNVSLDYGDFFGWLNTIDVDALRKAPAEKGQKHIKSKEIKKLHGLFQGFYFGLMASNKETLTISKMVYPKWVQLTESHIKKIRSFDPENLELVTDAEHADFVYGCFLELPPVQKALRAHCSELAELDTQANTQYYQELEQDLAHIQTSNRDLKDGKNSSTPADMSSIILRPNFRPFQEAILQARQGNVPKAAFWGDIGIRSSLQDSRRIECLISLCDDLTDLYRRLESQDGT